MATYYVATTGNNSSGNGSIGAPWRTIQYGANQLSAGDTLYIRGGTYVEAVKISRSGTSGSPITIKAYTGETVIIDGQYTYPTGTAATWVTNNQYITHVSGDTYRWTPTGATVYAFVWTRLVSLDGNYITLEDVTIRRSRGRGIGSVGAYTGCIIRNVTVHSTRHNINADGRGSSNFLYENCTFYDGTNFAPFSRPAGWLNWGGAVAHGDMEDMTYRGLTIYNIWGEGILTSQSTIVEDCVIYNIYAMPILIEQSANSIVRRNFMYHDWKGYLRNGKASFGIYISDEPGSGLGVTNTDDNEIYNNIIVNMRNGIRFDSGDNPLTGNAVYNNTIIAGRAETIGLFIGTGDYAGNTIYNNLIYAANGGVQHNSRSSLPAGITMSYNGWGSTPASWAQGTGDEYGNPLIANPLQNLSGGNGDADNYRLTAASPMIDQGTGTNAPSDDYFGNTRSGSIDIGAHEYGATGSGVSADFTYTPSSGTAPLEVDFTNTSSGATSYEWYYIDPDGEETLFSTATDPTLTLYGTGAYGIRLVSVASSGQDEEIKERIIAVSEEATPDCTSSTEITSRVSESWDDGGKTTSSFTRVATSLRVGYDGTYGLLYTYCRFQNLLIPQGATIDNAYLTLNVTGGDENASGGGTMTIDAEDADTSTQIADESDYNSRIRTTASVDWSWTGAGSYPTTFDSADIASVIQEIVDRPGWASGNDITIFMEDGQVSPSSGELKFDSYNQSTSDAPLLTVVYQDDYPTAAFTIGTTSGERPLSVAFTNTTDDAGVTITSWEWQKSDDGGVVWTQFSTAENPTHAFEVGVWSIRLIANYGSVCSVESIQYDAITVTAGVPPDWVEGGTTRGARAGMP